ncbi:MAG: sll0787 family AIR synthase-like protein [Phormidesmis sp.]
MACGDRACEDKTRESSNDLSELVASLRAAVSILHKQDIQTAADTLGQFVQSVEGTESIRLGDDCAAIPDISSPDTSSSDISSRSGYLLLAAEGIWPKLVAKDPWFAGWCAVMVNLSDIAAMGGWAIAIVDALWSRSVENSQPIWAGMQAAAATYGVPIVGGHTNCHSPHDGLAVAVMGRSQHLLTSFDAKPGDALVMVINMAGAYYKDYPFWNAATTADPTALRQQLALLPKLTASGLCLAGKDISMGGLAGTLLMLCEASGCGAVLDLSRVPRPKPAVWKNIGWHKWLTSFPSFGFLLSVPPENVEAVAALFTAEGLACEAVGEVLSGSEVFVQQAEQTQLLWDLTQPLTGFHPQVSPAN